MLTPSITCPCCGLTSYNTNDIAQRFCGRCGFHEFFGVRDMLDRQRGGTIQFECDYCDDVLDTETADFGDAMARFRHEGWATRKVGDTFNHACPRHINDLTRESWK